MERDSKTLGIVIKSVNIGESGKLNTLLTPDKGLIDFIVYGARKTKKGIKAPLYTEGNFSLYKNGENGNYSLKDIDVISSHDSIMESYEKIMYASLLSEIALKLRNPDAAFYSLFAFSLDMMEEFSPDKVLSISLSHILYREGFISNFKVCPSCLSSYSNDEVLGFSSSLQLAVCSDCAVDKETLLLPPNARMYLVRVLELEPKKAIEKLIVSDNQVKKITYYLLRTLNKVFPEKLNSLQILLS